MHTARTPDITAHTHAEARAHRTTVGGVYESNQLRSNPAIRRRASQMPNTPSTTR